MKKKQSVLLGMSGGVDSTAAALLLQQQGYAVTGATLRLQDEETEQKGNAAKDIADAKEAARRLGIRHMVLDWREPFRRRVLDDFADAYSRGKTPNPCVVCNRRVKFPSLLEAADREGIDFIATGHYAAVLWDEALGRYRLRQGKYPKKDQSYVLYSLPQSTLSRVLLPLGEYEKEEIRAIAAQAGLEVSKKADSQDICFVPDGDYHAFLERHTGKSCAPGDFVDQQGNVLGRHRGIWHYTVGQRKGLGISFGAPVFVKSIDAGSGRVVLSDNESLFSHSLVARDARWIDWEELREPVELLAKIRYTHTPAPATVYPLETGAVRVEFRQPQRAITPGQAVVFYRDAFVAGGALID